MKRALLLRRRSCGLSLVEVALSAAIGAALLGAGAVVTMSAIRTERESAARTAAESAVDRALGALGVIAGEIVGASRATVSGPGTIAGSWSDWIEFTRIGRIDPATGRGIGSPVRIAWVLASGEQLNGRDDDGNGLADDGNVVETLDRGTGAERTTVLVTHVPRLAPGETANGRDDDGNGLTDEHGLAFERAGGTIRIRLSRDVSDGTSGRVRRAASSQIVLRNE